MSQPSELNATEQILSVWQHRSAQTLSPEDAREIRANVIGFFGALREWDRAERRSEVTEAKQAAQSKTIKEKTHEQEE